MFADPVAEIAAGAIVAVVSDSYDIYHAIREHWGKTLKDEIIQSGATIVVRPDSGAAGRVTNSELPDLGGR